MSYGLHLPTFEFPRGGSLNEVVLLPFGQVDTLEGNASFNFTREDAQGVIELFKQRAIDFLFDWEHQSIAHLPGFEQFKSPDGKAPAAAWAKELAIGEKGLVARGMKWTAEAEKAVNSGAYRYLSPVLIMDSEKKRVKAVQNAGLTNEPRIKGIPAIAARNDLQEMLASFERKSLQEDLTAKLAAESAKVRDLEQKLAAANVQLVGNLNAFKSQGEQVDKVKSSLADVVMSYAIETGRITPAAKDSFQTVVIKDPVGMLAVFKSMPVGGAVPIGRIALKSDSASPAASDPLSAYKSGAGFQPDRMLLHEEALRYQCAHGVSYVDALNVLTRSQ